MGKMGAFEAGTKKMMEKIVEVTPPLRARSTIPLTRSRTAAPAAVHLWSCLRARSFLALRRLTTRPAQQQHQAAQLALVSMALGALAGRWPG